VKLLKRSLGRAALTIILLCLASFTVGYLFMKLVLMPTAPTTITITKTVTTIPEPEQIIEDEYRNRTYALLQRVKAWVEETRGLRFDGEVEVVILSKSWVIEHWGKGFLNLTEVRIEEEIYKALFILPEDFNLTERRISRAGYMIAGSAGGKIYVVKEYFDPSDELRAGEILAHELTHILQGIHFKIPSSRLHDEMQAIRAVVEGDAGLIARRYVLEHGGSPSPPIREEKLEPLTAIWLFPYIYGEQFINYIHERRGWEGVNAIYSDMPRSTSEILHPEKYLMGWRPENVSIAEEIGDGWRLLLRDRLGEYFIKQMLRSHLSGEIAERAAEGWKGDLLEYYEMDDKRLLRWKILWEDGRELEEFLTAFKTLLRKANSTMIEEGLWIRGKYVIRLMVEDSSIILIEEFSVTGVKVA